MYVMTGSTNHSTLSRATIRKNIVARTTSEQGTKSPARLQKRAAKTRN